MAESGGERLLGFREITILDIARTGENGVTISGIETDKNTGAFRNVRLVPERARFDDALLDALGVELYARIKILITSHAGRVPHTEDYFFNPNSVSLVGSTPMKDIQTALESTAVASAEELFGAALAERKYVPAGAGDRSLGCIYEPRILGPYINAEEWENNKRLKLRAGFSTRDGRVYYNLIDRSVFMNALRMLKEGDPLKQIEESLHERLTGYRNIYLRLGLSRPWPIKKAPGAPPQRSYVQILGIHSFE